MGYTSLHFLQKPIFQFVNYVEFVKYVQTALALTNICKHCACTLPPLGRSLIGGADIATTHESGKRQEKPNKRDAKRAYSNKGILALLNQ